MEDYKALIKELIGSQSGNFLPLSINEETILSTDLGLDSLDEIELLMSIEEEFGIEVDDKEVANVTTVGQIYQIVYYNLRLRLCK